MVIANVSSPFTGPFHRFTVEVPCKQTPWEQLDLDLRMHRKGRNHVTAAVDMYICICIHVAHSLNGFASEFI
jgi:hypothetical protein